MRCPLQRPAHPREDGGIYLIRTCGSNTPSSLILGVGVGGLVPRTASAVLCGLPFAFVVFCNVRTHGLRTRITDLSPPLGSFVARVFASVTSVERCPGRGRTVPAADNHFASVFAVPTEVDTGSVYPRRPSPSRLLQGVLRTGPTLLRPPTRPRPPLPRLALRRPRQRSLLRAASPLGRADVPQEQLVMHRLLFTMAVGPAGPLDHLPGVLTPRRSPTAAAGSVHSGAPCSCRLAGLHGANSVRPRPRRACGNSTVTAHASSWRNADCTYKRYRPLATLLNCSLLISSGDIYMPIESENSRLSRHVMPQGVTSPLPPDVLSCFPSHKHPSISDTQELDGKGRLHTTDDDGTGW